MKINEEKCPFLLTGYTPEHLWVEVGKEIIWKNSHDKVLGLIIDKYLSFDKRSIQMLLL